MEKFVDYVFGILASLDFGVFYPVIVSSAVASVFLITMIAGFFVYRIRRADKTSMLALTLAVYTLAAVKIVCDLFSKPIKDEFVFSCIGSLFIAAASFAEYWLLCLQFNSREMLNMREKRLIARLSRFDDCSSDESGDDCFQSGEAPDESLVMKYTFENPFRRAEFLPVFKGFDGEEMNNYGVNFNEVLSYIDRVRRYDLTAEEEKALDDLETNVSDFSRRNISCEERRKLSVGLMKLVKLLSKYKAS